MARPTFGDMKFGYMRFGKMRFAEMTELHRGSGPIAYNRPMIVG